MGILRDQAFSFIANQGVGRDMLSLGQHQGANARQRPQSMCYDLRRQPVDPYYQNTSIDPPMYAEVNSYATQLPNPQPSDYPPLPPRPMMQSDVQAQNRNGFTSILNGGPVRGNILAQKQSIIARNAQPPSGTVTYANFTPTYIAAQGKGNITDGFPMQLPPLPPSAFQSTSQLHPFFTHDISEAAWQCFLLDIQSTASLSMGETLGAKGLSHAAGTVMSGGMIVGIVVKKAMRSYKLNQVGPLIDDWNKCFFHPRRVEAILTEGRMRLDSGCAPLPPINPYLEDPMMATSNFGPGLGMMANAGPYGMPNRMDNKSFKKLEKEHEKRMKDRDPYGNDSVFRLFIVPV